DLRSRSQSRGLTPLLDLPEQVHRTGRLRRAGDRLEGDREGVEPVVRGQRRQTQERAAAGIHGEDARRGGQAAGERPELVYLSRWRRGQATRQEQPLSGARVPEQPRARLGCGPETGQADVADARIREEAERLLALRKLRLERPQTTLEGSHLLAGLSQLT